MSSEMLLCGASGKMVSTMNEISRRSASGRLLRYIAVGVLCLVLVLSLIGTNFALEWQIFSKAFIEDEFGNAILAMPAGMLVAKRLRKYRRVQPKTNMPIPWYSYGILGVFITAFAICLVHSSARRVSSPANLVVQSYVILGFVLAALAFIAMVWKFVKVRQQYNLRTLFAFTTAIAVLCSIAHYVRIAPLLIFFAPPAMEWAKCRSALKAATPANDTSGMQPQPPSAS